MARRTGYELVFYQDAGGRQPAREWLRNDLSPDERRTVGAAMRHLLQEQGMGVCGTSFGRQLGEGLFEFRLREEGLLVRIFCHAYGDRLILLLGAYDKGRDPSERRQNREISEARARLREWQSRQRS
jgi:phage-related protein